MRAAAFWSLFPQKNEFSNFDVAATQFRPLWSSGRHGVCSALWRRRHADLPEVAAASARLGQGTLSTFGSSVGLAGSGRGTSST